VKSPSFSIVIPTFQRRELVSDALRALDNVDYDGPIEIIIVIDGSTDGTEAALGAIQCRHPKKLVVQRNTGRKDNTYSAFDVRLSKEFKLGKSTAIEPIVEVFNLFNSANILVPQTTNLIFNFDGTIRAGVGDPRQVQIGARLIW